MVSEKKVVESVEVMYNTIFFVGCDFHVNGDAKKNNIVDRFCIECAKPLCSICLLHQQHQTHNHVKIRRYIYNDVIKKKDLSGIFDCHGIKTYYTNKAKVIFLKRRRSEQQMKEKEEACCDKDPECCCCIVCAKNMKDNSLYCSIACKVIDIHRNEEKKGDGLGGVVDDPKVENGKRTKKSLMCKKRRQKRRRKGFPLRAPLF